MEFVCHLVPEGVEGTVTLLVGSPYRSKGGKEIGSFRIDGNNAGGMVEVRTPLYGLEGLSGKQALYLLFDSDVKGKSICELYDFRFAEQGK